MGRFGLGEGVMGFGGDDRDFQKVADGVERRMKQVASTFTSFQFSHPGFDAVTKGLDDVQAGAERASQGLLRLGRTYYFTRAADGLRDMAQAAEKFTVEIAKGNASVGDLIEAMAKKIPFGLGAIVEAGRDIHGFLTGDTVAIADAQASAAATEKRIDFQKRMAQAIREVGRAGEDAQQKLNFTIDKSPFITSVETFLKTGERAAEDLKTKLAVNEKLFKEANDEKIELGKHITNTIESLKSPQAFAGGGTPVFQAPPVDPEDDPTVKNLRKRAGEVEKQANALRESIGQINAILNPETGTAGRPTFTAIFNLIGTEAERGLGQARAAIDRFIGRIPELTKATQRLVASFEASQQARAGNIGQFIGEQNSLGGDFARGLLNPDLFRQLTDKSKWDQVARSIGSIFQQYAPIVETIARLTDSNFGGGFRSIFGALGQVPGLFPGSVAQPKDFRSSFVGLTELGKNIQAAAASEGSKKDPVQDGILQAVSASLTVQKDQLAELKKNKPATVQ